MTEEEERVYIAGQLRAKLEIASEILREVMHMSDAARDAARIALVNTKLAYDLVMVR